MANDARSFCGFRQFWPRNEGVIPEILAAVVIERDGERAVKSE